MRQEYLNRIKESCHVEFFLSANDGARVYWPWRMQTPKESSAVYREMCDTYILDSDFSDESVTNQDVLDRAITVDADVVVLEDVYQDFQGTVDKVAKGMALADDHEFDGEVMVPLQKPYVDCWQELGEPSRIALGGLKDEPAYEKVVAAKHVRRHVGNEVYIHGLGWGATPEIIDAVRKNPGLLDGIDAKTPFSTAQDQPIWPGEERMSSTALYSQYVLLEKCRRMSSLAEDPAGRQTSLTKQMAAVQP